MIEKRDAYGAVEKEAETAEEYLLLEIERLKEENKMLREELERCNSKKTFQWVLTSLNKEANFITNIQKDGTITIKQMVEESNE